MVYVSITTICRAGKSERLGIELLWYFKDNEIAIELTS